jgi:hypothetical protein
LLLSINTVCSFDKSAIKIYITQKKSIIISGTELQHSEGTK